MDFHAAMETFAEAWVAANTQTAVNSDAQGGKHIAVDDLPTQLPKNQLPAKLTTSKPSPPLPPQHSPTSSSNTKSLPLHCIIEQTTGPPSFDSPTSDHSVHHSVELDSYAILPGNTLLSECVRAALVKLGYNATEAMGSKGAIQIKNWKPLSFEAITDDKQATIDDILGELTQVATLRIRMCSDYVFELPEQWTDNAVRCCVLTLLKEMNQSTLGKLSPLSQSAISNIANWKYTNILSREKCQEFGKWYKQYLAESKGFPPEGDGFPRDSRLTFHPKHEVPLLRQWYNTCKTPNDRKLNFYAAELNKGHVRQERPKVTVAKLKIWWKNERQREKRIRSKPSETETLRTEMPSKSHNVPKINPSSSTMQEKSPEKEFQTLQNVPLGRTLMPESTEHELQNLNTGSQHAFRQPQYHHSISPSSREPISGESHASRNEIEDVQTVFSRSSESVSLSPQSTQRGRHLGDPAIPLQIRPHSFPLLQPQPHILRASLGYDTIRQENPVRLPLHLGSPIRAPQQDPDLTGSPASTVMPISTSQCSQEFRQQWN